MPTRVLLAESENLVRAGLRCLLVPTTAVVGEADDLASLRSESRRLRPDVVVSGLGVLLEAGFASVGDLQAVGAGVVVVGPASADLAAEAFAQGAAGWITRFSSAGELREAVSAAAAGRRYLTRLVAGGDIRRLPDPQRGSRADVTPRALEVLRLLAQGKAMKQVAADLAISPRTVAFHKYKTMRTLGIGSSAELVQYAVRAQLV